MFTTCANPVVFGENGATQVTLDQTSKKNVCKTITPLEKKKNLVWTDGSNYCQMLNAIYVNISHGQCIQWLLNSYINIKSNLRNTLMSEQIYSISTQELCNN